MCWLINILKKFFNELFNLFFDIDFFESLILNIGLFCDWDVVLVNRFCFIVSYVYVFIKLNVFGLWVV